MDVSALTKNLHSEHALKMAAQSLNENYMEKQLTGVELIANERQEQIEKHKWAFQHDQTHTQGELAKVAAVLSVYHTDARVVDPWEYGSGKNPWGLEEKLKDNTIHRLKVAGALIAAEIDRLQYIDSTKQG